MIAIIFEQIARYGVVTILTALFAQNWQRSTRS
jgi:hypothetical protein